jgi:uncharacterized protein
MKPDKEVYNSDELFITTISGRFITIPDPDPDNILIHDIARHLSNNCRFNGCCNKFYSLAQHSMFVSWLASVAMDDFLYLIHSRKTIKWVDTAKMYWCVPERAAGRNTEIIASDNTAVLEGLMHDAHEAYLGDCISPVKRYIGEKYKELERRVDFAIRRAFGLASEQPDFINMVDKAALILESEFLMSGQIDLERYIHPGSMSFVKYVKSEYPFYSELIGKNISPDSAYKGFMSIFENAVSVINNERKL